MKLLVVQLLQPTATSSFLGPNILLSTLLLNTLNLCSSLSVRYQVSHPYKRQNYSCIHLALNVNENDNEKI